MSKRRLNAFGFLCCAGLLAYGYYLEFVVGLEPCPLCIFQRLVLLALGLLFLLAVWHRPQGWGSRVYGALLLLTAAKGAALAAWHVYLQSLPPEAAPECGPGLAYLLDIMPITEVITTVLGGSGECAEIGWRFLGLSIPAWTLLCFVALGLAGTVNNWRPGDRKIIGASA